MQTVFGLNLVMGHHFGSPLNIGCHDLSAMNEQIVSTILITYSFFSEISFLS